MDWENLYADETRILTTHFSKGRYGSSIDKVIIHHNAGNLTIDGVYDVWQTRAASAHYQVASDGSIGQLVYDADTAWHASNWAANTSSIGIEHADVSSDPWAVSDACLDAGAHLVAAICKKYGLGRPEWGVNLFGHSDFASTECPAELAVGGAQHDAYVAAAQAWYDQMTGTTPAPAPVEPTPTASLVVDGDCGSATCTEWQKQLGCTVDGEITGQWEGNKQYTPAVSCITDYSNVGKSNTVMAIQSRLGLSTDGFWGHDTSAGIQTYLNQFGYGLVVDSVFGSVSATALQSSLNAGQW